MYLGSWDIDDLLTFTVNTHSPSTGAETDADAVPAYRVYEDETGTPILTGTMALLDDANTVGHYSEQITLSAANGFEVGKSYTIRIRAVVGGVAGSTVRNFQVLAPVNAERIGGTAATPATPWYWGLGGFTKTATTDRWSLTVLKNGVVVTTGVTNVTLNVYDVTNNSQLITAATMTDPSGGTMDSYEYSTTTNRTTAGRRYSARITYDLDGSTRGPVLLEVGRDAS